MLYSGYCVRDILRMNQQEYKVAPDNYKEICLNAHWCGDDYCNCNWVTIDAIYIDKHNQERVLVLWESCWISGHSFEKGYNEEFEQLRSEVIRACIHYKIPYKNVYNENCIWDWE